jgi:methanogenic corrinoid protein MtbC1
MLVKSGMRDQLKLMVGGGVTTPALKAYIGADFQAMEATEGVAYCIKNARGQ